MAKKPSEVLEKYSKKAERIMTKIFDAKTCQEFATNIAEQIRKRTRLGYGVASNGNQERLKELHPDYVELRRNPLVKPHLSEFTKPKKSNLTATGQMLDAITGKGQVAKIIIEILGNRTRELLGEKSTLTNKQVASKVSKARPFFALTNPERNRFIREVKALIKTNVKNAIAK